jgi:hypothetical protein
MCRAHEQCPVKRMKSPADTISAPRAEEGKQAYLPLFSPTTIGLPPPHWQEAAQDSRRSCSLIGKKVSMVSPLFSPLRIQHFLPWTAPCCCEIGVVVVQDSYRLVWISCRHGMKEASVSCTQISGFILARQPSRRYHQCADFSGIRGAALGRFSSWAANSATR